MKSVVKIKSIEILTDGTLNFFYSHLRPYNQILRFEKDQRNFQSFLKSKEKISKQLKLLQKN